MDAALPGDHGGHERDRVRLSGRSSVAVPRGRALSLAVLAVRSSLATFISERLRRIYVVCAALALYFNVFVGVVQAFLRFPC